MSDALTRGKPPCPIFLQKIPQRDADFCQERQRKHPCEGSAPADPPQGSKEHRVYEVSHRMKAELRDCTAPARKSRLQLVEPDGVEATEDPLNQEEL